MGQSPSPEGDFTVAKHCKDQGSEQKKITALGCFPPDSWP